MGMGGGVRRWMFFFFFEVWGDKVGLWKVGRGSAGRIGREEVCRRWVVEM